MSPAAVPVKRPKSRAVIVDVAERLWGERGLDAVSLREISAAAGLSNPASVQYHFGGRDGLVNAIYTRRLPAIDARRSALLAAARVKGREADLRILLDCLFRPLLEQQDERGQHSYASFLRQVLQFEPAIALRGQAMSLTPVTVELLLLIERAMPDVPPRLVQHRLIAMNLLMLDVLIRHDRDPEAELLVEEIYADTLDILVAGVGACPTTGNPNMWHPAKTNLDSNEI